MGTPIDMISTQISERQTVLPPSSQTSHKLPSQRGETDHNPITTCGYCLATWSPRYLSCTRIPLCILLSSASFCGQDTKMKFSKGAFFPLFSHLFDSMPLDFFLSLSIHSVILMTNYIAYNLAASYSLRSNPSTWNFHPCCVSVFQPLNLFIQM